MHYKSPDNSLHFLDDDSLVHLLPKGSIAITDEEVKTLLPKSPTLTLADVRNMRDALLEVSDWTQLPDSPLTLEQRSNWASYRQELRDITKHYTNLDELVWPTAP